eukprot:Amastigsp_a512279_86.p2 type:complete len:126 gc:universal Amastigsp_a512279_86:726-349(-)
MCVHHNLFLVGVLERLGARDRLAVLGRARKNVGRARETPDVAAEQVHQHGLGNVVRVVPGHDRLNPKELGPSVERLAAKHTAECAVVAFADGLDDFVHGPAVKLLVRENPKRKPVLLRVALDGLQ